MSQEAAKWMAALRARGWRVTTVAGEGGADVLVPGLAIEPVGAPPPPASEVAAALADADVAVVENLCSLPLNPAAAAVVASVLRGRPAVLRHHDLPWQRARFADRPGPPDDPAWAHVTINRRSERELAERGVSATTIYNTFETDNSLIPRHTARALCGMPEDGLIVLQPTRAILRKNVPLALELATYLGATYWLTGPAEEGYGPELAGLLGAASVPVVHRPVEDVAVAYAACDVVAFPSTFEGFGNPVIESAVHRRPLAVASYPVLEELRGFGFRWLSAHDPAEVAASLKEPDESMLDHNFEIAERCFSVRSLPERLGALFEARGWAP